MFGLPVRAPVWAIPLAILAEAAAELGNIENDDTALEGIASAIQDLLPSKIHGSLTVCDPSTHGLTGGSLHPLPSLMTVLAVGAFVIAGGARLAPIPTLLYLLSIELCRQFDLGLQHDYYDRNMDRGRPEKPVASGQIPALVAWVIGATLGLISLALALVQEVLLSLCC